MPEPRSNVISCFGWHPCCGVSAAPPRSRLWLLRIQAEILRARRNASEPVSECERKLENSANGSYDDYRTNAVDHQCEKLTLSPEDADRAWRELTYCFLRLANLDNGAFDRIGRYETCLWRQIVQTLFALQTIRHY